VKIDQLTMETYEENDLSGIPELIEVVRLQDTGPQEASRAIRKKLYASDWFDRCHNANDRQEIWKHTQAITCLNGISSFHTIVDRR